MGSYLELEGLGLGLEFGVWVRGRVMLRLGLGLEFGVWVRD